MVETNTADSPPISNPPLENTHTDTCMPDADTSTNRNPNDTSKEKEKEAHILQQTTFRKLPWAYFHLTLTTPSASTTTTPSAPDLSPLLISPLVTSALRTYLGTMGAAIPIDILKTAGRDVWIRVPRQDAKGVRAALSSWAGSVEGEDVGCASGRVGVTWKVGEQSGVLGLVGGGDGRDLFG